MRLSKGFIRTLSALSLAKALCQMSIEMDKEDNLILKDIIDSREELVNKIINFIKDLKLTKGQYNLVKKANKYTSDIAIERFKKQDNDLDYLVIFIIQYVKNDVKTDRRLKELFNNTELDRLKRLVDNTYVINKSELVKVKIRHIGMVNSILDKCI